MRNSKSLILAAVLVLAFVGIIVYGFRAQQRGTASGLEVVELDESGEVVDRWCATHFYSSEGETEEGIRFRPAVDPGQQMLVENYRLNEDSPRCK